MTALVISNVVLWVVVLALLAVVLALTRQLGVLHERITPVGALMLNKGLTVGEQAPTVDVVDLGGSTLKVGAPRADGKSTLLLFTSRRLVLCGEILAASPVVKSSGKDESATGYAQPFWKATAIRKSIVRLLASTGWAGCLMWFRRR